MHPAGRLPVAALLMLPACDAADPPTAGDLADAERRVAARAEEVLAGANLGPEAERALAQVRRRAAELRVSRRMKQVLQEEEGAHMRVYRDITGVPTVGIGHVVRPEDGLQVGDVISKAQMLEFLARDLEFAEGTVREMVGDLELGQHEYDALVDLAFNIGPDKLSPEGSPGLHRAIGARDYVAISDELIYSLDRMGRPAPGLRHRSERRRRIFRDRRYDDPRKF